MVVVLLDMGGGKVRVIGPLGFPLNTTRRMAEILADGYESQGHEIKRTSIEDVMKGEIDR